MDTGSKKMNSIPSLSNYRDWFKKAQSNFEKLADSDDIYDFVDCLLTLNALPEWIYKSDDAPEKLRLLAEEKVKKMKGNDNRFNFDEDKLDEDIDHQLRFIRLFCNHAKHGEKKTIPLIVKEFGGIFPATFPIEFKMIIKIGEKKVNAKHLISSVIAFWEGKISEI